MEREGWGASAVECVEGKGDVVILPISFFSSSFASLRLVSFTLDYVVFILTVFSLSTRVSTSEGLVTMIHHPTLIIF
jgi:hypothetical protein